MDPLSSRVLKRNYEVNEDDALDGLYDDKGFFFRQRRGHLNLRRLEAIDLERLIRQVDIDILQQHIEDLTFCDFRENDVHFLTDKQIVKLFRLSQLTIEYLLYSQDKLVSNLSELAKKYSTKKRELYKKRKELSGLKEEVHGLHGQLKAKRRNLSTLEKIVKDSNRTADVPQPSTRNPFIKFFVTFPDGLFVEFEEAPETTIRRLLTLIINILTVDGRKSFGKDFDEVQLKLFLKGKMLKHDTTLDQCGITDGDTILASYKKEDPVPTKEIVTISPPKEDNKHVLDAISIQMEGMKRLADEVNEWSKTLQAAAKSEVDKLSNHENKVMEHIDERLRKIEDEIKSNLGRVKEIESQNMTIELKQDRQPMIYGDLENDNEDAMLAINEINSKLAKTGVKMDSLDSQVGHANLAINELKDAIKSHYDQVLDLRKSILDRMTIVQEPAKPSTTTVIEKTFTTVKTPKVGFNADNKWNNLPIVTPSAKESIRAPAGEVQLTIEKEPVKKPIEEKPVYREIKPEIISKPEPKIEPKVEPKVEIKKETPPIVKKEVPIITKKDENIKVIFPINFNPDLVNKTKEDIMVLLNEKLDTDEIVFEIRKSISNKINLPFGSVLLSLNSMTIKLGIDVDSRTPFSPLNVKSYAEKGLLQIKLNKGSVISNPQIDLFVPAWKKIAESKETEPIKNRNKRSDSKDAKSPQRRKYSEDPLYESVDPKTKKKSVISYAKARTSLDELLSDIESKSGLTDDELTKKRETLEALSSASESENLKKYKKSLTKSVSAATIESGPESAGDGLVRSSMRFSKEDWPRLSSSIDLLQIKKHANKTARESPMRRSIEQFLDDTYDNDESLIYSSINEPISLNGPSIKNHEFITDPQYESHSTLNRSRYSEIGSPSFVSSLGSSDINSRSKGSDFKSTFGDSGRLDYLTREHLDGPEELEETPYYSKTGRSTGSYNEANNSLSLTGTLTNTDMNLSTTIDSEADIFLKNKDFLLSTNEIKKKADQYERDAADRMADYNNSPAESPFKDYHNRSQLSEADLVGDFDNASVHSLALSDSNQLDEAM